MPVAPLYVHRPLLNGDEVARHFLAQGLKSTLAPDEMHVTVVYSKHPLDWDAVSPATDTLVVEPMRGARGVGPYAVDRQVERLGEHGVVTLVLQPQNKGVLRIIDRWNTYRAAGASHDYDRFLAHVTVSYAGEGVDLSRVKPFPGALRFGPEVRETIDKEWSPDMAKEVPASKALFSASAAPRTRPDNAPMLLHPGGPGDSMTTTAQARAESPQGAGYVARIIKSAWSHMAPADRLTMIQDAAVASTLELGKATELLEGGDRAAPGQVEDLFDGPPDDRLETVEAGGPDGSIPAGKVGVGKPQQASGVGAATMEREYSRHAPQTGVQRATEELGAKLAAQGRVMKSLIAFGNSLGDRLSMVEASLPTGGAVDVKAIEAAVAAAVAKAIPQAVSAALGKAIPAVVKAVAQAKAEGETEADKESGEDDEEDDEEADEAESGSGTEIEITNENEEEGEDEAEDDAAKATRKAAAQQRLTAKALVKLAKAAERDSREAMEEGRLAAGKRQHMKAEKRMAKARLHVAVAKSLRDGSVGASMKAIEAAIGTVAKALKEAKAKNQDKWPAGKSATAPVVAPQGEDLAKAVAAMTAAVEKANAGYALMTTNVQGLMAVVGGQSRDPSSGGVPPVGALFKAVPAGKESQINALVSDGTITMRERDKAIDALGYLRVAGVPETVVNAAIDGCSPAVQAILRAAA